MRLHEERVKLGDKPLANLKGVHCSCARQDALGKGIGLGVDVENAGLVGGLEEGDDAHDEDDGGGDAEGDEGQLPVRSKGDDEGGDERSQALKGEAQLFRDAAVDEAAVAGGLRGDGAAGADVKVGHLLAERGAEVRGADVADDAVRGVRKEAVVDVREEEARDAEVDKVEAVLLVSRSLMLYRE